MPLKRRGAETGSGFQEAINRANEAYERAGLACITRKAIPGKFLINKSGQSGRGSRGAFSGIELLHLDHSTQPRLKASDLSQSSSHSTKMSVENWRRFIPESKAEPDYGGTIAPTGRAIFYDAKTTRREALDFDNLHAHQIGFLERMARLGAIAGFLVEFSRCGEVYFLPIQVLARWRDTVPRKSLPYQFFVASLTLAERGKGLLIYDYLAAIEKQEQLYGCDYLTLDLAPQTVRVRRKAS
ncbi:MAG: Holliday junction resolvase RecU [Acidobacteriota bacterium]